MEKHNWSEYLNSERERSSFVSKNRIKNKDFRNEFESDLGRVIFSAAVRRLHDKTQVVPLTIDDNVHSRLTHSLEVMNIGSSLLKGIFRHEDFISRYGRSEDIRNIEEQAAAVVQTICMAHDIGNPPFGHFGEQVIQDYFTKYFTEHPRVLDEWTSADLDFTKFDGNAEGFRVLTKLQCLNDIHGLNLTYSTLAAYLKYPNWGDTDKNGGIAIHKHGVFFADKEIAEKAMQMSNCTSMSESAYTRHPLSYIMEAADSICYLTMDLEDAYNRKWVTRDEIINYYDNHRCKKDTDDSFENRKKLRDRMLPSDKVKGHKWIVDFRVRSIEYFVSLVVNNYIANIDAILTGKYQKELLDDDDTKMAKLFTDICVNRVYAKTEVRILEITGQSVINGLLDILIPLFLHEDKGFRDRGKSIVSPSIMRANILDFGIHSGILKEEYREETHSVIYIDTDTKKEIDDLEQYCESFDVSKLNNYYKFRTIVDFVSSMTDQYAVKLYQKLSGQRL